MRSLTSMFLVFLTLVGISAFGLRPLHGQAAYTRLQLLTLKEVQAELKLSEDQKSFAAEVMAKLKPEVAELRKTQEPVFGPSEKNQEIAKAIRKLNAAAEAKVSEKLDDAQRKRFLDLFVQVNRRFALSDAEVQKTLGISEDVAKQLEEVKSANAKEAVAELQELSRVGADITVRQAKLTDLAKTGDEKILALLTPDQRAAWEKLGGTPIEIDFSPLRPQRR